MGEEKATLSAKPCAASVEKRYPGQRYVYSRRDCGNRTTNEHGYCHVHKHKARPK